MHRYVIERTFPGGLELPTGAPRAELYGSIGAANRAEGVTWIHSYLSADRTTTYCLYEAPSPEAIRRAAEEAGLPVDRITEVSVLDPYAESA